MITAAVGAILVIAHNAINAVHAGDHADRPDDSMQSIDAIGEARFQSLASPSGSIRTQARGWTCHPRRLLCSPGMKCNG